MCFVFEAPLLQFHKQYPSHDKIIDVSYALKNIKRKKVIKIFYNPLDNVSQTKCTKHLIFSQKFEMQT